MGKWEEKELGEVLSKIQTGKTPPKSNKKYYEDVSVDWFCPSDFDDNIKELSDSKNKIAQIAIDENKAKLYPINSILLVAIGATIGKVALLRYNASSNQQITCLTFNDDIYPDYAYYWLRNLKGYIINISSSATLPIINQKGINDLPIKYPPLSVQKQIVAKLDALFARIDKSIALLEENIQLTKDLMASVLDGEFNLINNKEFVIKKLGEVSVLNPKKSEVKEFLKDADLVSFLPMTDLNEKQISFIPKQSKPLSQVYKGYTYFKDGDVLLAKVTPSFENGKAGIAKNLENGVGFGTSEIHILRPKTNVLSEWIYFAISTKEFLKKGELNLTGASGLKRVPKNIIEEHKIPVPTIEVQKEKIVRIKTIQLKLRQIADKQTEKLKHLQSLKSSLLDRAFKGELL